MLLDDAAPCSHTSRSARRPLPCGGPRRHFALACRSDRRRTLEERRSPARLEWLVMRPWLASSCSTHRSSPWQEPRASVFPGAEPIELFRPAYPLQGSFPGADRHHIAASIWRSSARAGQSCGAFVQNKDAALFMGSVRLADRSSSASRPHSLRSPNADLAAVSGAIRHGARCSASKPLRSRSWASSLSLGVMLAAFSTRLIEALVTAFCRIDLHPSSAGSQLSSGAGRMPAGCSPRGSEEGPDDGRAHTKRYTGQSLALTPQLRAGVLPKARPTSCSRLSP